MTVFKRTLSLLLCFIIISSVSVTGSMAASYPKTHENTYRNTGNGAIDITEIAKTQVGYKQNSVGTKYGYWYNEYFVNQPWCAMFVSWCAEQAGISTDVILKFAGCGSGVNWFKSKNLWQDSAYYGNKNYTPKKGDIIFYKNKGSTSVSDHVGIVIGMNGNYIHTIEGNSTNETCCEFKTSSARSINSSYVLGYGTPNYEGESIQLPEVEETDEYESWQVTDADALSLRKSYSTSSKRLTTIPQGTIIQVTEFKKENDYLWGYTTYLGKSGWCALDYCTYINGSIDGEYYQLAPQFLPPSITIYLQERIQLKSINTLGATYKVGKKSVLSINQSGYIRGVSEGTTTVTCTTNTGEATCKVKVINPSFKEEKITTSVGETYKIEVVGAQEEIEYLSRNESVATVDENGVITGVSEGKVNIIAYVSGVKLVCRATILKESETYQSYLVEKDEFYLMDKYQGKNALNVEKGTILKVTEVKYSDTYTWGKTTFEDKVYWVVLNDCKYLSGSFDGVVHKVRPYLKTKKKKMYIGQTTKINLCSAEGKTTYKSEKTSVAKVNQNGKITAKKKGKTNIIIQNNGATLSFQVTVVNLKLSKNVLTLGKNQKVPLKVTGTTKEIKWESENKKIAKVRKSGVVVGKSYGTTYITATVSSMTLRCKVKVSDPKINPEKFTLKVGQRKKIKIEQNQSEEISWKSSNKKVVKVSKKGTIRGLKKGKARIIATVDGVELTATIKVK